MDEPASRERMKSSSWRYVVGYVLGGILVALAAHYVADNWERVRRVISGDAYWLLGVALIVLSNLVARAELLRRLSREAGAPVAGRECFCLVAATNMLSMLTLPAAGVAYRASYVSRRHSLPLSSFAAGTAVFALAGLLAWCVLGTGSLIALWFRGGDVHRPISVFALVCAMTLFCAGVAYRLLSHIAGQRRSRVQRLADECTAIVSSRRIGGSAVVVMLCCAAIQACGFHFAFRSFGLPFSAEGSTAVAAFHQMSGVTGVTPGAVGIQETVALFVSTVLGADVAEMLVVLALVRTARIGFSILIGAPSWWLLAGFKRRELEIGLGANQPCTPPHARSACAQK